MLICPGPSQQYRPLRTRRELRNAVKCNARDLAIGFPLLPVSVQVYETSGRVEEERGEEDEEKEGSDGRAMSCYYLDEFANAGVEGMSLIYVQAWR